MRVVVIGAGLLGSSTAWHLAQQGAEVVVVEASTAGGAASRASFAWLNAQHKSPAAYFELNSRGIGEHRRLAEALGDDSWLHGGGDLQVGTGEAAERYRAGARRSEGQGYPVREISRDEAAQLEPDFALPDADDVAFIWYPEERWIESAPLIGRLLGGVRARGGQVRERVAVVALATGDDAVRGVRLADGGRIAADAVVLAAGTGSEALAGLVGVPLAMSPSPGLLVVTSPEAAGPRRLVHSGAITLRPDGCGRVMLANRTIDATLPRELASLPSDAPEAAALLESAASLYPALAGATVEAARVGRRSVAADGMPVAGFSEQVPGLYLLVSHSGATLTAILGRLAAEEVLGRPASELEPYRMTAARAAEAAGAKPAAGPSGS
jgi:glycine/D-amino acid oxidase-like deaminating enzyme